MNTIIIVMGLLFLGTGSSGISAGELSREQIAELRAVTAQRRIDFFTQEFGKPLVKEEIIVGWRDRGDFTRNYGKSILEFAIRAFELNEQLDTANAALQELCQYHRERPQTFFEQHSFHFLSQTLARMYLFYGPNGSRAPGQISDDTLEILHVTMWEWMNGRADIQMAEIKESETWRITGSENHHSNDIISFWMFSLILKGLPDYQNKPFQDGSIVTEHYTVWTEYFKEYIRQRACKGMLVEIDSPSYSSLVPGGILNFYDFSDDPILKDRAGKFMDLFWALWAESQLDFVQGGAKIRCTPGHARHGSSPIRRASWYLIGDGEPNFIHFTMIPFVTTSWQIPDIVLQIAYNWKNFAPYEIRERKMGLAVEGYDRPDNYLLRTDFGGILRYTYCTPDFIMGALLTEARPTRDWVAISSQNRWAGVVFSGHPDARVYSTTYNKKEQSILNGFWAVQSKGTMISQRINQTLSNKTDERISGEGHVDDWRVFFSNAGLSTPEKEGQWIFAEANDTYVGVCIVEGDAELSTTPEKFGHWFICKEPYTPVIIEAGQKSDYESFEAFRNKALSQSLTFKKSVLTYKSLNSDTMVFPADQTRLPEINGKTINLAPELVYDSPFVQSVWDSGIISIQFNHHQLTLNFNE
ncbi:MAG: hypothetical protein WC959_00410 [Kiritimatiellales bacterium]